jgi:hypothetical protein
MILNLADNAMFFELVLHKGKFKYLVCYMV